MPVWIWVVVAGIVLSAMMTARAMRQENKEKQEFIEAEGKIYMDRIERKRFVKGDSN
ncbi:MAG: Sporulation protein YhaL [Bacillales bacterium]|nr:Sporulation protein YhaL [Bacillales bacterium]